MYKQIVIKSNSLCELLSCADDDTKLNFLINNFETCNEVGEKIGSQFNTKKLKTFYNFFSGNTKTLSESNQLFCLGVNPATIAYFDNPSRKVLEAFVNGKRVAWTTPIISWYYNNRDVIFQHFDLVIKLALDVKYTTVKEDLLSNDSITLSRDQQRKILNLDRKINTAFLSSSPLIINMPIDQDIQFEYWIAYCKALYMKRSFQVEYPLMRYIRELAWQFRTNTHEIYVKTQEFCKNASTGITHNKWNAFLVNLVEEDVIPRSCINTICHLPSSAKILLDL